MTEERLRALSDYENAATPCGERLKLDGFEVLYAKNGESGLSLAEEKRPDLILLDIMMPNMNGMEMLASLRATEWGKYTGVILLTNADLDDSIKAGIAKYQPAYYLAKLDTTLAELIKKVHEVMGDMSDKSR